MKKNLLPSLILTLILIFILGFLYPLLIRGIAYFSPGSGNGVETVYKSRVVGFDRIGQSFTSDKFFQGRPSAVNYNAAGSGGSNKSIYNPEYRKILQSRLDTFLVHNPGIKPADVPVELITASGSGLDPDISPAAAFVQVQRIAHARGIETEKIANLIDRMTEKPLFGFLGPEKVNVLKINIELDKLK
ncbi:MAG: potassium-transporting ATPase subunit KdpC [Bacteroidetes bacterium]|nr:potassium-transporting ATPase subunit KdpC [Bacteroidota bacterium]